MNDAQNITRDQVSKIEAAFLAKAGVHPTFSLAMARQILGHKKNDPTPQFLERLQTKGWIKRIRRGRFAVIPLSSGEDRSPQLHEFVVAMELVSPAVIAYWSALNHHGLTEQLPRTVFVATDHPVRRQPGEVLGVTYKIVSLKPEKIFGVTKDWINEVPFQRHRPGKDDHRRSGLASICGRIKRDCKGIDGFLERAGRKKIKEICRQNRQLRGFKAPGLSDGDFGAWKRGSASQGNRSRLRFFSP